MVIMSTVTDMNQMFTNSQATKLDLISFDASGVTYYEGMFESSQVKNLIARTQADADNYQISSGFPTGVILTFGS